MDFLNQSPKQLHCLFLQGQNKKSLEFAANPRTYLMAYLPRLGTAATHFLGTRRYHLPRARARAKGRKLLLKGQVYRQPR